MVNKIVKAYFRDLYDKYIVTTELDHLGRPQAPTRQLLATWVVEAWDMVPREIVQKAWTACGYPNEASLGDPSVTALAPYTPDELGSLVEKLCGENVRTHFDNVECDADPPFPEEEDDEEGDNN